MLVDVNFGMPRLIQGRTGRLFLKVKEDKAKVLQYYLSLDLLCRKPVSALASGWCTNPTRKRGPTGFSTKQP
jgi:hypothetical protein